ncbi:YafY family transcriptional regulator [Pendulispora brunnea]|uniref:YafY family transcriptional regulator n=1 Tax=Pendulispora brunnea TaxID=2905690 RepID=A0ABZ2K523_9BACT
MTASWGSAMTRSERLLRLVEVLRGYRSPVSGAVLAGKLQVSLRTLYRDVAALQKMGARIDGEPGVGYVLRPGFLLPPLIFTEEELEALTVGWRWVAEKADTRLADAGRTALSKIAAVLPRDLRRGLDASGVLVIGERKQAPAAGDEELSKIRRAIRTESKLSISYKDGHGKETRRVIWPLALGFFQIWRVVAAWCELRTDLRHFRTDRISKITVLNERYPKSRQALLREWTETKGFKPR